MREIVIPELTKEVNEDKNFSQLRQVYNSLILATWYKKKIKDSILEKVYGDKNKVAGVNIDDPQEKQRIYERYLRAFKKGVYNYIKEEKDPVTLQSIPRKYFSGGASFYPLGNIYQGTNYKDQLPKHKENSMLVSEELDPAMVFRMSEKKMIERGTIALRSMAHSQLLDLVEVTSKLVMSLDFLELDFPLIGEISQVLMDKNGYAGIIEGIKIFTAKKEKPNPAFMLEMIDKLRISVNFVQAIR